MQTTTKPLTTKERQGLIMGANILATLHPFSNEGYAPQHYLASIPQLPKVIRR